MANTTSSGWGDAELTALGRIAATFAELEWYVDRLLAGFITPADIAILITAGETIRWKLDKLSTIAKEVLADPLAKSTLLDWIKTSLVLISRRNDLIHSFYLVRESDQSLTRMKATTRGGRWKARSEPVDLDSLIETANLLAEGLDVADLLVQQLVADCPEWRDPASQTESKPEQTK